MDTIMELLQNDTALVSGGLVLVTGLLTGPIFHMNTAAVGSITGILAFVFNLWVRASVYSKSGAAQAVVTAATQAVKAITPDTAGGPDTITPAGEAAVATAARQVLGTELPAATTA